MSVGNGEVSLEGAIDCDGHILEPPDLWEKYLERQYRDRAIRIKKDDEGWEYLEFDGKPSRMNQRGVLGFAGAMGQPDILPSPERTYLAGAPFGSMDPKERVARLDQEGLAKAILYPTIGLLWECEIEDPEISAAYCRAYNRWIVDFCSETGGRLVPIAHLSGTDPAEATKELVRAVKDGCKGAFFAPFTWTRKSHGHPDYDAVWATAQDLDVPIAIHPTAEPSRFTHLTRFDDLVPTEPIDFTWYFDVLLAQSMQQAFVSLFQYGVFERFPQVKVVVLESQAGWIGYLLDRMDAVFDGPLAHSTQLKEKPSTHFKRQCWISADPDEKALQKMIEFVGSDKFFWATDFPHPDHTDQYIPALRQLVTPLSETARQQVIGANVAEVYKLGQ
jgi:predicted TIM-barrel fold metal-dependent hydrolase